MTKIARLQWTIVVELVDYAKGHRRDVVVESDGGGPDRAMSAELKSVRCKNELVAKISKRRCLVVDPLCRTVLEVKKHDSFKAPTVVGCKVDDVCFNTSLLSVV